MPGNTVISDDENNMEYKPENQSPDDDVAEEEDDEEDEEGQDEYEKDDFIVDDVDEEEPDEDEEDKADSDKESQKRKRKRKRESENFLVLDEDDYEPLQDNNITGFHRPRPESKNFKLLKKAQRDTEEERSEFDGSGKSGRAAEEKLKRSLFGDDEGPQLEDIAEEEGLPDEEDLDMYDDDDMSDFIVVDENGAPVWSKPNKKKSRQSPWVSSSAQLEIQCPFAFDEFESVSSSALEEAHDLVWRCEKYMTDKDLIDRPERVLLSEESTGSPPTDDMSLEEESNWIHNQLVTSYGETELSINKEDIMRFLEFTHIQKLDVPFIAAYRKEACPSLLPSSEQHEEYKNKARLRWHKILWAIQDLLRKWLLLQKRKNGLESYYHKRFEEESRRVYDETRLKLNQQLFESITNSLKAAESEREVVDVDMKFNLHFPPGEVGADDKQISLEKMRMEDLEDPKETPEERAANFTCAIFESPQTVLTGARLMTAVEISCEPSVRKHVRSIFMDNAVVTTTPTPDGNSAIDSYHQFAGVKWLRDKPLTHFEDAQWLLIEKAEEEKLLKVTIKLPDVVLTKLIANSHEYYLSDVVSKSDQTILHDAFHGFLLPLMEKEARSLLRCRAKNWLLMEYGKVLWDKVTVAAYQRKDNEVNSDDESAPRVMACCYGSGKPSTTFVMLDSFGEVVDTLNVEFLSTRSSNSHDRQRKKIDQDLLLRFITDHQPTVVALGAGNLSCTKLKDDIYEIIFKIMEKNPRDIGHEMDSLKIVYVDDTLPRLYENSPVSVDQLSGHSGIIRRAVALGRYLQNPLAMVATLCGPGREILSWKLHALENFLTPDERYGMIEQVMVDVTNQVGFDVNLAIAHEWLFGPLQFISGLGPRKAAHLQRSLVKVDAIYSRKDLLREPHELGIRVFVNAAGFLHHKVGKLVFFNAAGFLRIRRTGFAATSNKYINLLDDTRIHPESYNLAQELAKDVYDADVEDDADVYDEDIAVMVIQHVREKPGLLRTFEVEEYAKSKRWNNKRDTLECIRLELIHGFQDYRRSFMEPSQDEEFHIISGETEDTISEGRIVQVIVHRVQPERAICVLESGLTGLLSREECTDDWRDNTD